ncbi:hypothetical protein JCM3765_003290 [Sporobolomyces pararoseus]
MKRLPLLQTTNSLEHASSNNFPSTSTTRVSNAPAARSKPNNKVDAPRWDGTAGIRVGGARSCHSSITLPSQSSEHAKRARPSSPDAQKSRKKARRQQSSLNAHPLSLGQLKLKPAPPLPPPLPKNLKPSYQDFLLCARFHTQLVKPSPVFSPPSSPVHSQLPNAQEGSTQGPPTSNPTCSLLENTHSLSSSSSASPTLSNLSPARSRHKQSFPSDWEFLRPPLKDRIHLSEDEFFSSDDHDEWAEGADPHYHDIRDLHEGEEQDDQDASTRSENFWEREFEPWKWIEQRLKFKMNRRNNGDGEEGMLPDAWGLGAMRKAEEQERRESLERKREKKARGKQKAITWHRKKKESSKGSRKGKERGGEGLEKKHLGQRNSLKSPFTSRLKKYYDIEEPFTDDSEIEKDLENEAAVGLAALALPLIKNERERRKRRRMEGREDDDSTDEDWG